MAKDMTIQDVLDVVATYMNEENVQFIERAYIAARDAHEGQFRKSGEPYIIHPIQVAGILAHLQMDPATVAAGFLHDVVEDTSVSREDLVEQFSEEVAELVDGVTKLDKLKFRSNEEKQAENHRKMFIAMAQDVRVILIKLADRLHNMRTLHHVPKEKQKRISAETLDIFAPLAHRLGISTIKWELEDTALRYLNPQQYYRVAHLMDKKRTEREEYLENVMGIIRKEVDGMGLEAEISGRPKHIYSIYRKMVMQHKEFNEIYDLLAVRIVLKSIKDCYAVLGVVHTLWKPMPGRFKDYIAMPKQNMYQSLHTTVVGPGGDPLEVQIRTEDMHKIAEYGVAAHWAYKEGRGKNTGTDIESKLTWFREILELQHESPNAEEFMESLKFDLFSDMVYVFTPKGDVIELPKGSVPLDFAYRVHSEVGNQTIGVKVNGKMVPLDEPLETGDIIEVLTSKQSFGPSRDWLKIVNTSQARTKIKQYFKRQARQEHIEKGREMIEHELNVQNYTKEEALTHDNIQRALDKFSFASEEDMYAQVGAGGFTALQVANRLTEKLRRERKEQETLDKVVSNIKATQAEAKKKVPDSGVIVKGIDSMLIRLAKCCSPVPGDDIIGFITKGRGVSVHRTDCPNVVHSTEEEDRFLDVAWAVDEKTKTNKKFDVDIEIFALDRPGLLNEVMIEIAEMNVPIAAIEGKASSQKTARIHLTIQIKTIEHLEHIARRLKQIPDVQAVHRVTN